MYQIIDDTDTKITTLSMTISENQNYWLSLNTSITVKNGGSTT
jgi:hypothetical protein